MILNMDILASYLVNPVNHVKITVLLLIAIGLVDNIELFNLGGLRF